jgi:hypothetical protein
MSKLNLKLQVMNKYKFDKQVEVIIKQKSSELAKAKAGAGPV